MVSFFNQTAGVAATTAATTATTTSGIVNQVAALTVRRDIKIVVFGNGQVVNV